MRTAEYYIEKLNSLNFIDAKFAVCVKEIANDMQILHPEIQIWVDEDSGDIKQIGEINQAL